MIQRPLIGITGRRNNASVLSAPASMADAPIDIYFAEYAQAVSNAGGIPVFTSWDAEAGHLVERLDAVLFAGGEDVDPSFYGATPHPQLWATAPERDAFELALITAAIERDVPVLGICRGQQLLNVALGGTLNQHVEGHLQEEHRAVRTHDVRTVEGTRHASLYGDHVRVNSLHHQSIAELGHGIVAAAYDGEGMVEAIDVPGARAIAVQWHPEAFLIDPAFDWLITEARKGTQ